MVSEDSVETTDEYAIYSETTSEDVLSVELPIVADGEPSPFDFILDPYGLLYETGAMQYGGGTVEERATMFFRNAEGEYDLSRHSDKLSIVNHSNDPVIVTVSASVSDLEGITLTAFSDFSKSENPSIYLALTDDNGNEQPILEDEQAQICVRLDSGVYSFGLTGACNPDANWQETYVHPIVTLTWHVEPIPAEEQEEPEKGIENLPTVDAVEVDSVQEELPESSEDSTISLEEKTEETAGVDLSNAETEKLDYSKETEASSQDSSSDESENLDPSEEVIDNEPELESDESFSGDDVLSDESKDNIAESRENVENSTEDAETDKDMDASQESVSDSGSSDIAEEKDNVPRG